ncbi:MAG: hypothetical protein Q3999_00815 [Buchananella hordeovulneris]|nr:hypothetical protein [Buchananella hordeovulneris]
MTACPYCFTQLASNQFAYRCTSGRCPATAIPEASEHAGYPVLSTPGWVVEGQSTICINCNHPCTQEVCLSCRRDIPTGWRNGQTLTVAVTGARGVGKSVWIGVMINTLERFLSARGAFMKPLTNEIKATFELNYKRPMYDENGVLRPTPPLTDNEAFQREPMIWPLGGMVPGQDVYLVIRDMAGEDLQNATQRATKYNYLGKADLTLFLFDPFMVPGFLDLVQGRITADKGRFGAPAREVLPNLLEQYAGDGGKLGLVVSKFDAVQELVNVNTSYARVFANPATLMRRDNTFRPGPGAGQELIPREQFELELEFLNLEVISLLGMFQEGQITAIAENARAANRVSRVRHFAVSALGETPKHANRLTVRGISPFRVLDPLLWEFAERRYF